MHGKKKEEELGNPAGNFVDVRDVAQTHVEALLQAAGSNQRFAPSGGPFSWQDVMDIIHATKKPIPEEWKKNSPIGKPGSGKVQQNVLDGSKVEKKLGIKYHSLKDCIEDSLEALHDYEKRGWKGVPAEEIVYLS